MTIPQLAPEVQTRAVEEAVRVGEALAAASYSRPFRRRRSPPPGSERRRAPAAAQRDQCALHDGLVRSRPTRPCTDAFEELVQVLTG